MAEEDKGWFNRYSNPRRRVLLRQDRAAVSFRRFFVFCYTIFLLAQNVEGRYNERRPPEKNRCTPEEECWGGVW